MGIRDTGAMPDTYGLPEYFVDDLIAEIIGPNVRIVCGASHGGQMQWLFSCVLQAEKLMTCASKCTSAAAEVVGASSAMPSLVRAHTH